MPYEGRQKSFSHRNNRNRNQRQIKTEKEIWGCYTAGLEDGGKDKPRNACSLQESERQGNGFASRASKRNIASAIAKTES